MLNSSPVLFVEDDRLNVVAVEKAFAKLGIAQPLIHARNGQEALEYLSEDSHPKPGIILLDLHMPKMDGIEFLRTLKADPALREIPAIMLTTSQDRRDVAACFALNAAGYMIKPLDDESLAEVIKTIMLYWTRSELPRQRGIYESLMAASRTR